MAHLIDVDAHRVRRLGVLAAGAQAQAEAGLVEDDGQHHIDEDADVGGQVGLVEQQVSHQAQLRLPAEAEVGLEQHEPAGRVVAQVQGVLLEGDVHQKQHHRRGQQVQGGAADGLVRLHLHRREAQQHGEQGARRRSDQHGRQQQELGQILIPAAHLHGAHKPGPREGADDHNALQGQVDDAAALGKHAGQGHQEQGDGVNYGLLQEKGHGCASFPAVSAAGAAGAGSLLGVPALPAFLRSIRLLKNRVKALRYTITATMMSAMYSL